MNIRIGSSKEVICSNTYRMSHVKTLKLIVPGPFWPYCYYPKTGYGFEDYPGEGNYGVSLTSPEWIRVRIRDFGGLREAFFRERGWDNHQDVFGYVRE